MSGDEGELERFCASAYPHLVAALTHQSGDRWLAEELAPEALVRACDRWPRVRGLSSPVAWAFRGRGLPGHVATAAPGRGAAARARHGTDPDSGHDLAHTLANVILGGD